VNPASCRRDNFIADESGATMFEYGLLLLLVALVVVTVAKLLGQNVLPLFQVSQFFQ